VISFLFSFADDLSDFLEAVQQFVPWIVAIATIIGVIIKIRRDVVYKLKSEMGKDMLYLGFKMIREIFDEVPAKSLFDFLKEFKRKYVLESDMKETVLTLANIALVQGTVKTLKSLGKKVKRKDKSAIEISNKKFLNRLRANRDFDAAIESMSIIVNEQLKIQSKLTREKMQPFIDDINTILNTAKENIPANREKRMEAESLKRKAADAKCDAEKAEIGKKLHKIFRR